MTTRKSTRAQESESTEVNNKPELINPFDDLDALTVSQDFEELAGVKKALVTVPVRKPHKASYVRVHPAPEYRKDFACLELEERSDLFIVHPNFAHEIEESLISRRTFYLAITRQGVLFLWPIKTPVDGRKSEWPISERAAAEQAMTKWTRVWANMRLGAYEHKYSTVAISEPDWPDVSLSQIFSIAFKNNPLIQSHDHPAMKLLRGE